MIEIKNVKTIEGKVKTLRIKSDENFSIDASSLTLFPGLIDPHVHFRTPGAEYKEDWKAASLASISGGFTTVFDMPNNHPACVTKERLEEKCSLIDSQLKQAEIPLRYHLYIGADKNHFEQIPLVKDHIIGIKVFMGSSSGDLLMDDQSSLHAIFALAKAHDLLISVHAENEEMIKKRKACCPLQDVRAHSWIRNVEVALSATKQAIALARQYDVSLNILHVSTKEEIAVIKAAKEEGLKVTAETTPHYLFLSQDDYAHLGTRAQVNPSLKSIDDQKALFAAINEGVIDMIGSDHAPHTLTEKDRLYGKAPSGLPGIETTLPLLLTAYHEGKLSLSRIVELTYTNIQRTFGLEEAQDVVLVDLEREKVVLEETLNTKCGWSPYAGKLLKGWPIYTIIKGKVYHVDKVLQANA